MKQLLKAVTKSGSGTIALLLLNTVSTKIIAVVLGASGIGLFSILRQTRQTASILAGLNGSIALVQGVASRSNQEDQDSYIGTVFWIMLIVGVAVCSGFVYFSPFFTEILVKNKDAGTVSLFRWLSVPVFLNVFLVYCLGLLNAYRAIGRFALVSVVGAFIMAILAYPTALMVKDGRDIAFIWMMSGTAIGSLAMASYFLWREGWLVNLVQRAIPKGIFYIEAKKFLKVALVTLISGLSVTGTLLAVRSIIIREYGLSDAGIFDVAWTLSMIYISIITKSFSTYYLPTLSSIVADTRRRLELIEDFLRISVLLIVPMTIIMVVLKPFLVYLLYSDEFIGSVNIIRWMIIGDYFKITSWVFAMPILAYQDLRIHLYSEVIWNVFFFIGSYFSLVFFNSIEGIGITFLVAYILYLIFAVQYCKIRYQFVPSISLFKQWIMGLVLLLSASLYNWEKLEVEWLSASMFISLASIVCWIGLEEKEKISIKKLFFK